MIWIFVAVVLLALVVCVGNTYGRQLLDTVGRSVQVTADGRPEMKPGGVTVDWNNTVAAVAGSDVTYEDGVVVRVGEKGLRYGQVLTKITLQPAQTVADTGATAGTFTLTGTRPDTGVATTQTVAFNATTAAVQTAMDAIFGAGNTVVTGAGALPANVQTVTFQGALIGYAVAAMVPNSAGLTGGTAVVAVVQGGGTNGWYGPYDPAATDGRQTLARGSCWIMNETVREQDLHSSHPPVLDGGRVFRSRIIQAGTGAASLAAGPTLANLEAAFPRLSYAPMN
jgi:hypothetical protein